MVLDVSNRRGPCCGGGGAIMGREDQDEEKAEGEHSGTMRRRAPLPGTLRWGRSYLAFVGRPGEDSAGSVLQGMLQTFLISRRTLLTWGRPPRWHERSEGRGTMRQLMSSKWAQVSAIGVFLVFLAPLPLLPPSEPERFVLAEIGGVGLAPAMAVRGTVVEVYEGNLALLKVTDSQIFQLRHLGVPITELTDRTTIAFPDAGIRFDTSVGAPSLSRDMMSSNPHTYIVQFIGPIKSEWVEHLRALGGVPEFYVPNDAFVVRMNAAAASGVAAQPFVAWAGAYHPAYKIPKALAGAQGVVRIAVLGFDDVPVATLAREVLGEGGNVFSISQVPHLLQAFIDGSRIDDVARLEDVAVLFNDPLPQPP